MAAIEPMNIQVSPVVPQLRQPVSRLQASLQAVAKRLSANPAFTSVSVHMVDNHYKDSAATVAIVNAQRDSRRLAFTNANVAGHRVDLATTYLGTIFATKQSGMQPSRLCPAHLVYGMYCESAQGAPVAIECVFDMSHAAAPLTAEVQQVLAPVQATVRSAVDEVQRLAAMHHSLADALLLHEPTTPNAYAVKWDVVQSTNSALSQYPLLREYVQAWSVAAKRIAESHGGQVVAQTGDGQNIVFMLPGAVNRADPMAVQRYGAECVVPALRELQQTSQTLHGYFWYNVRIAAGLGYVEQTPLGEHTGKLFFELSSALKHSCTPEIIGTSTVTGLLQRL